MEIINIILAISGVLIGVVGVIFGYREKHKRVQISNALTTQYSTALNRVRSLVTYNEDMEKLVEETESLKLTKWLWMNHKGLSDLYAQMVGYYISNCTSFDFSDIENQISSGVIATHWEEKIWREHVSLRAENQKKKAPEFKLDNNEDRRKFS